MTSDNPAEIPGKQAVCDAAAGDGLRVALALRVLFCAECGLVFAAPESLCLRNAHERRPVHCPAGHANAIGGGDDGAEAAAHLRTLAELMTVRTQLTRALRRVAELTPTTAGGPPTDAEIVRRARVLATRAEPGDGYGRRLCRFCGKSVQARTMPRHFLNAHRAEVAAMTPGAFE